MKIVFLVLISMYIGYLILPIIIRKIVKAYWHLKTGTCFRFKGTGKRENRDGTVSEYCIRCNQPRGYH